MTSRSVHRFVTLFVVVFTLFLGVTGTAIQLIDLTSILTHAPASDANVRAMREAFDGPGTYAVRRPADYDAAALPADFGYRPALAKVMRTARAALGNAPLDFIEFRMAGVIPVGQVGYAKGHLRVDARSGRLIERRRIDPRESDTPVSARNDFKHLHRMTVFGDWALLINIVVAVGLATLIVTGALIYLTLRNARLRARRPAWFWLGGGTWRMLHRSVAIVAAAFLAVVTLSGAWLAVESLGLALHMRSHPPGAARPGPQAVAPVKDPLLPDMLDATLAAVRVEAPNTPIKVLRLRDYAGYRQGVVVTGGTDPRQLVFDTADGRRMSLTEPGYPPVPFPFGWQAHQVAKSIHRGDFFGLTGRIIDLLSGLAMIYLSISGIVLYWTMWRRRRDAGRRKLIWR